MLLKMLRLARLARLVRALRYPIFRTLGRTRGVFRFFFSKRERHVFFQGKGKVWEVLKKHGASANMLVCLCSLLMSLLTCLLVTYLLSQFVGLCFYLKGLGKNSAKENPNRIEADSRVGDLP